MHLDKPNAHATENASIEELFDQLESPLLGYALRLTGDRAVAEDLVQDAFMKLHAQRDEVRQPRPWLYRTVHNAALNHARGRQKLVPLEGRGEPVSTSGADGSDPAPPPDEKIIRWEGIGLVRLSLEALDARSREVVQLKFFDNLSYREIGARTGLTISHVGYLLHHALKAMADELAKNGMIP